MIEAMADGAVKMGLSRDTALKLAAHTLMVPVLLEMCFMQSDACLY